jgi:hypothetical protein
VAVNVERNQTSVGRAYADVGVRVLGPPNLYLSMVGCRILEAVAAKRAFPSGSQGKTGMPALA